MRQWFIYLLFAPVSMAFAIEEHAHRRLTLDQAIINVLEHSPLLKAVDYEAKAAAARIRAAQQSPAFRTSVEFENFAGSGRNHGADNLEATLSLSKVLELGDKPELRGLLAQNKAMLLRNDQDAKRLDLLAETTKRFTHVIINQERLVIANEALLLAKQTQRIVNRRVKAGKSANAEFRRTNIFLARKELELAHAQRKLTTSRLKLATLWGEKRVLFTLAQADLFSTEQPQAFERLVQLLERNPNLLRFATVERLAQTRIELAKSRRQPDIEVSGGIRYLNETDDAAFVLSFDIPLGSASRAAPFVDEAEMLSEGETQISEQRQLALHATLFELHQEITHAIDAVTTLRERIIPQALQALKDYQKGYAAGRYSFLELTDIQRVLLDSRLEAIMAAADYHRFRIEIDRLTGAGLSSGANP